MKILILFIILFVALFTIQFNKDIPMRQLQPSDTILALGDSLTYGYNAHPDESYPTLLSQKTGLRVINAGIPAETSSDGLKRLPKLLEDNSIQLMILFFGGNDILQQLPMTSLQTNLTTMITMAKEKEIDVLLIAVPNMSIFGFTPLDLYQEIAKEQNIPLLDEMFIEILENPTLKSDQIHPNALGYKKMYEEIYHTLKKHGWVE